MVELRILHLEDSPSDAALARRTLEQAGFACTIQLVATRETYVAALAESSFDLVLSAYALPGLDGLTALEILRETDPLKPFILVSGTVGEEAAIAAMRAGAADYVLKNSLNRLPACVERAVAEARERRVRAEAEANLRVSERRFDTALQSMAEGVVVADARGIVIVANSSAARILGVPCADLVGAPLGSRWVYLDETLTPLPVDRIPSVVALRTGLPQKGTTLAVQPPGGELRWMVVTSNPLREDADSPAYGVVSTLHEITERKRFEAQLQHAQKLEAIGRLSGGIAHDFNNILTSVIGFTELLLEDSAADDPRRRDLEAVRTAGHQGAVLTKQLLAFSRRQVIEVAIVNLHDVTTDMERLLMRVLGADIRLTVVTDPGLGAIKADRGHLDQVLMNLVVNARDAMPRGGQLTIETRNVFLDEAHIERHPYANRGAHVMLAVTDTGTGIDADVRRRIFEPFFTTKARGKGTGLGLSMVWGIVKQLGGALEVYSERGRGTTFQLFFPRVDDQGAAAAEVAPVDLPARADAIILLVEDEELVRALAARVLRARGYRLLEASNGEEALRLLERATPTPHLLLTDTVLPGISGPELAARVRESWPHMRVLFVSGYTDDTVVRHGLLEPGHAFLAKPFSPAALARKVAEVLGTHARDDPSKPELN